MFELEYTGCPSKSHWIKDGPHEEPIHSRIMKFGCVVLILGPVPEIGVMLKFRSHFCDRLAEELCRE